MAIFAKDMDLEAAQGLRWVQLTDENLADVFGKERAQYLPDPLSLQDSLDTHVVLPVKPCLRLQGLLRVR